MYLAVGTDVGTLHIIEIPKNLIKSAHDENRIFKEFLEREEKRVLYFIKRWEYHKEQLEAEKLKKATEVEEEKEERKEDTEPLDEKAFNALKEKFQEMIAQSSFEI